MGVMRGIGCLIIVMLLVGCGGQSPGGDATSGVGDAAVDADRAALVALYRATDGENWEDGG